MAPGTTCHITCHQFTPTKMNPAITLFRDEICSINGFTYLLQWRQSVVGHFSPMLHPDRPVKVTENNRTHTFCHLGDSEQSSPYVMYIMQVLI